MDGRQAKPSKTAGTNHPNGVMTYFYLPASLGDSAEVSVAFMEADGDLIRRFSTQAKEKADKLEVEPGSNRFVWDMQYEKAKDFKGMIMWWAGLQGPKAVPGKYRVQLATPTDTLEQTFEILKDPRISSSIAELRHQFDFMQEVNAKVSEAHQAIMDIRAVREQLSHFTKRWKGQKDKEELTAQAEAIDSVMTEVEQALYQTKNRSRQDPLNYPIKLTNKLAHLNSLIAMGDFPPTQQQLQVKAELTTKIDEQLERFYALKKNDIPTFNKAVKAKAVDVIMLEE